MGEELRIALVQSELIWEQPKENMVKLEEAMLELTHDVDLVILPEMFTSGFTMTPETMPKDQGQVALAWMVKMAGEKNCAITGSVVFYEHGTYYNRLFFVRPDGTFEQYDKRHTFTLAGEDKKYTKGNQKLIVDFKGFKICPLICYDLRFPVWSRNSEGYDVLLYVANWPAPRIKAWDILLQARAVENMSYTIGVNRVGTDKNGHEYPGHSGVYDALGNTLVHSKNAEVLFVSLSQDHLLDTRQRLGFLKDRDQYTVKI
jgi:predicted amidohydrolase